MLILGDLIGFVGNAIEIIKGCGLAGGFEFRLFVLVTNNDVAQSGD